MEDNLQYVKQYRKSARNFLLGHRKQEGNETYFINAKTLVTYGAKIIDLISLKQGKHSKEIYSSFSSSTFVEIS